MVVLDEFRDVSGHFATGVTVVTLNADGFDHGMTVNSFTTVSLDPPLVLFNADKETNTHDLVSDVGHYGVNILAKSQEQLSNRFAGEHHEMEDPFEDIPYFRSSTGAPIFKDAVAYLDCSLKSKYVEGDHTIYVGQVKELDVQHSDQDPLTFFKGKYGTIQ